MSPRAVDVVDVGQDLLLGGAVHGDLVPAVPRPGPGEAAGGEPHPRVPSLGLHRGLALQQVAGLLAPRPLYTCSQGGSDNSSECYKW